MDYPTKDSLATTSADVIREIREKKWDAFTKASQETNLDPYVALARLLVRIVEQSFEGPDSSRN
jgi:hypothetical protein